MLLGTRIYHYSTKATECKERTQSTLKFNNLDFNAWERIPFFFSMLSLHETEEIFKVKPFLSFALGGCLEVYYIQASPVFLFLIVLNPKHST